jgi:large subunit ribosomal protein L15
MREDLIGSQQGARKNKKRIGRGNAAGQGTYAGRGLKGQKSRSGKGVKRGFEGGQNRMIKGLPMKRGFTNIFKTEYELITLDTLNLYNTGDTITPETLREGGYIRGANKNPVKILGTGQISSSITILAHKFTRSARASIEAAGGTAEEI